MLVTNTVGAMLAMTVVFSSVSISPTMILPALGQSETTTLDYTTLSALAGSSCQAQQPDLTVGSVIFHKGHTSLNDAPRGVGTFIRGGDTITTGEDGFVAIELADGKVVSVQPATHLTVECSADVATGSTARNDDAGTKNYSINEAHLLGAVRG